MTHEYCDNEWKRQEAQCMGQVNLRKVAMIGCGYVGSAAAFALMQNRVDRCGSGEGRGRSYGYRPWDSAGGKYENLRRQL